MESRILKLVECIQANKSPELSRIAAFQLGQAAKEAGSEIFEKIIPLFQNSNQDISRIASQALFEMLSNQQQKCSLPQSPLSFDSLSFARDRLQKKKKFSESSFHLLLTLFRDGLVEDNWEEKFSSLVAVRVLFLKKVLCEECEEDFICRVFLAIFEDNSADYSGDLAVFPIRNSGAGILALARQGLREKIEKTLISWRSRNLIAFLIVARKGRFFSSEVYEKVVKIIENQENEDVITEACHYLNKFPLKQDQELAELILMLIEKSDTLSGFIKYAVRVLNILFSLGCDLRRVNQKIYQFFVHSLTEVRVSTLSSFASLAKQGLADSETVFLLTVQLFLLETNREVLEKSSKLLRILIENHDLQGIIEKNVKYWNEFLANKTCSNLSFFIKADKSLSIEDQYSFVDNNTEEDINSLPYLEKKNLERIWRLGNFLFKASLRYKVSFFPTPEAPLSILACPQSNLPSLISLISKDSEGKFDLIRLKTFAAYKIVKLCWKFTSTLPEKITSLFQTVVTGYKHELTTFFRVQIAKTAARLTKLLKSRMNLNKFIINLLKHHPTPLLSALQKIHKESTPEMVSLYSDMSNASSLSLISEYIDPSLHSFFISRLPGLLACLPNSSLTGPLCRVFSQIPSSIPLLVKYVLVFLEQFPLPFTDPLEILKKLLEDQLKFFIPFAACVVVPLLKHLNTENGKDVSGVFSEILYAVVLDQDSEVPPELKEAKDEGMRFLANLKGVYSLPKYSPRVCLNGIVLREYQKEGVAWMRFLASFRLGGLLCDEMGLGKTIQSLCAIAEAHLDHPNSFSLIVCPASVVGHWLKEAKSYLDLPVHEHPDHGKGLLVISYNILNTNIEKIKKIHFLYAVLDEGHLLSNPKTKTFKAVKSISSTYRLILTGTPIQNKILDVWPFFDFLMPGFLGTQSDFTSTYQKHLKAKKVSNSVKFKDEYRALQKLHALHKKILPFALRRLKKDILQDLPEKIIQDYYVDLTSVQSSLIKNSNVSSKNALENLTFIEKVCFHPFLVDKKFVDEESPKLNALKELLEDCEISEEAGASHKALVFSKSKKVLDLVEKCLRLNFPETRFLRLDGDTPQVKRYEICNEFNQNLQVRVLIVTTKAGGVGLNLQAASVVIFIDHSWNPVADMQAMDRAHRIGQKKVVNIYRLIARDSLEEEILGLQVFKSKLASALVNTENSCMSSVDSVNLLSSFNPNT